MVFKIKSYEHVGIRVSDRLVSIAFYEKLGWRVEIDLPEHQANEMVNDCGVYINLIFNGEKQLDKHNVLQDASIKLPGLTHAAFVIDDMNGLLELLEHEHIKVTGGPVVYSGRRQVVFIRDPDGNVLEFNELLAKNA